MNTSDEGLNFITLWEGCNLKRYRDAIGFWTIGVGHLIVDADPMEQWKNKGITAEKALELLKSDVDHAELLINRYVSWPLKQTQFDALRSWAFNCGSAIRTSTLIRELNIGNEGRVGKELVRWNRAGGKILAGLTKRRAAEGRLFNLNDYGSGP